MNDLISREQLEEDMYEACFAEDYYFNKGMQKWEGGNWIRYKVFEEILAKQPSAEKTGRWQYVDYGGFGNYHCTACGKICICNGDYDFCPNCGARMVD